MKVALLIFVFGVLALQSINGQCLYPGVGVAPAVVSAPAVVTSNAVATTLADTLSLLTVSSLLSEKLPFGCPICAPGPITTVAPVVGNCGCGCGGFGYPYGSYII